MDHNILYDREEELRAAMESVLAGLHVAIPVRVQKDSDGKTVSVRPTIKRRQIMPDGTSQDVEYPDLMGLVRFASGGGLSDTHPVATDDEGLAIMSSLSFWNWREAGGTQSQVDSRRHDLSDAVYVSGIRSKPRDLQGISAASMQRRSDDKKTVHDTSHTGITSVREGAAHQVNGMAVQTEVGGTKHHVDAKTIVQAATKFLHNCGIG